MDTTKNIHNISANFFFFLAFTYVVVALLFRNDMYVNAMIFLMRVMDMPFAFIALMYGGSGLYLQINEGKEDASAWGIIIFALCLLIFGFVVFVNFAFPSVL